MKDHNNNEVWIGVEQLENDPAFIKSAQPEFVELPIVEQLSQDSAMDTTANRRDFLKYLGFGLGAATIAASCDIPVKRAIPYVVKPDEIIPGVATYYASSFVNGGDYCPVLVKTREGRPIKIEGNALSSLTSGGTSARAQASVLSLYDTNRYQGPLQGGKKVNWDALDAAVGSALNVNSQIRIIANTILSPTDKQAIADFTAKYPNTQVVMYDPVSSSAMLEANESCFGQKTVPNYSFDKADVIVSFGADFLGTWISPIEFARQYAATRKISDVKNAKMSHHVQVESAMTLTGSNADNRILVKPSETGAAIATLYNAVASATGQGGAVTAPKLDAKATAAITALASELVANNGKSLVVSGSNNVGEQTLVNAINNMIGSYGNTISFVGASNQRQGTDYAIQGLIREMGASSIDAAIVWGANPAFDLPNSTEFAAAFAKVAVKISLATTPNETAAICDYVAPNNHYLESWGDAEPKAGHYSLIQPTISPLFDTRQGGQSLLTWAGSENLNGDADQPYYEYLKANWEANMFSQQSSYLSFQAFWDASLHDGVFAGTQTGTEATGFAGDVNAAAAKISQPVSSDLEISFFETVNLGAGQYAGNPWLQEMPDPITRCVWDNYLAIPIEFDGNRHFDGIGQFAGLNQKEIYGEADKVEVEISGSKNAVTVIRQFGQMRGTVSMALGYGRTEVSECGKDVGSNVFPWLSIDANGNTQYYATAVTVSDKVAIEEEFACVQYHHTMGVSGDVNGEQKMVDELAISRIAKGYEGSLTDRSIINHSNLNQLEANVAEWKKTHEKFEYLNDQTLYPYEEFKKTHYDQGHHWGLHFDLNACIGCGACQVACISENNVPVVGKYEVFRHHEMTWLRIDRYFYGDYENPNTVYQPMMCQHCDNAPCENVCPVSATNHSSEGLNQMAYNRCIGTRYCANNCPYKVRRFNWLDYTTADLFPVNENSLNGEELAHGADNLTRMVLNPDVTVRSRGVMEKCSFCVQRIQEGKLTAKQEGRALRDGEVKSACQTACPTGAITFGDTNDPKSAVSQKFKSELSYAVLEEVNTRPSVRYTAKINNRHEELS